MGRLTNLLVPSFLATASGCSGCTGQVETVVLYPDTLKAGSVLEGVLFYPPQLIEVAHEFTTRIDETGKVVGQADNNTCRVVLQKEEVTVLPDFGRPMLVRNGSGPWSAAKFSVSLNNGMLTAVNAEPTQKPSEVITAVTGATTALGLKMALVPGAPPACNAGPRIRSLSKTSIE